MAGDSAAAVRTSLSLPTLRPPTLPLFHSRSRSRSLALAASHSPHRRASRPATRSAGLRSIAVALPARWAML
eukprot:scaffold134990_cov36-Tisochrysis_lutea.AAC.2